MISVASPCQRELKETIYAKAYELARDMIIKGQDPYKDEFVEKTFCIQ